MITKRILDTRIQRENGGYNVLKKQQDFQIISYGAVHLLPIRLKVQIVKMARVFQIGTNL